MFSNLRTNSQLYIFHKGSNPYVEIGQVVSVSQPVPKFQVTNFMQPQELVVDIVVKINESNVTLQKLPANLDIADQGPEGNIVITTSREAMNAEIDAYRQKSLSVINSIDHHKKIIQDCEQLLQNLNPEFAQQAQQKHELDTLKLQVSELTRLIQRLTSGSGDEKPIDKN